jgi:hypothetical protein
MREEGGPIWALTAATLAGEGATKRTPTSPWMSKSTGLPESVFTSEVCTKGDVILGYAFPASTRHARSQLGIFEIS